MFSIAIPSGTLLSLLLSLSFTCLSHCSIFSTNTTAYEVLEANGFPIGLLPATVSSYELAEGGGFKLYLEAACTVKIPNLYPIKYKATITGNVVTGKISSLRGITVKVLFIWWRITSITVSGENLVFKVGPVSASYAISNFNENPVCKDSHNYPSAQAF